MPASRELMETAAMLLRRLELLLLAMIAVGIMARPLSSEAEPTKTFKSEAYGFSVQYPSSWHTLSLGGVFYIQSFPSSRAVRGDVLPSGGAAIKLLVPE